MSNREVLIFTLFSDNERRPAASGSKWRIVQAEGRRVGRRPGENAGRPRVTLARGLSLRSGSTSDKATSCPGSLPDGLCRGS